MKVSLVFSAMKKKNSLLIIAENIHYLKVRKALQLILSLILLYFADDASNEIRYHLFNNSAQTLHSSVVHFLAISSVLVSNRLFFSNYTVVDMQVLFHQWLTRVSRFQDRFSVTMGKNKKCVTKEFLPIWLSGFYETGNQIPN